MGWDMDIMYFPLQKSNKVNNSYIKCRTLFFLSFKEITKVCGKKSSAMPKVCKGDYFSPNETGGILPSTLVLEGVFRFCVIPRCQMFRKTLLLKSQRIKISFHMCYIYLKHVQYLLKKCNYYW